MFMGNGAMYTDSKPFFLAARLSDKNCGILKSLCLRSLYAVTITEPFLQHYKSARLFMLGVLVFLRSKQMV
jgi:hypothetical protein